MSALPPKADITRHRLECLLCANSGHWRCRHLFLSHIHHKGKRGKPLTRRQTKANKTRSKIRVRVEHVFGFQERSMGGKLIRTIGMARAKAKIGMMNLVYNMSRLVQFERGAAALG
jgi:IS5 family transposase